MRNIERFGLTSISGASFAIGALSEVINDCIGNLTKSSYSDLCFVNHSRLLFFFSCLRNEMPSLGKPVNGGKISISSSGCLFMFFEDGLYDFIILQSLF